jgi:hypothetical protein
MRKFFSALACTMLLGTAGGASGQSPWPFANPDATPPAASAAAPGAGAVSQPSNPPSAANPVLRLPGAMTVPGEGWLVARAQPPLETLGPLETVPPPASYVPSVTAPNLWAADCDECPLRGMAILVGYDSFRGVSDDSWQNNGIHTGLNYGTRLGWFSDLTGIGLQMGGTAGAYNWSGTDYRPDTGAQTQGFVTYGLFRKATDRSHWSAAIVEDWMLNSNYGVFSENPTLSQWRGQIAYAISPRNEFGLWGTQRFLDDHRNVAGVGPTTWRAINQLNLFWHYKWTPGGADTWLWFGRPENDRLAGGGSLGDYVVGALANVPLTDQVGLYTMVQYMHPSARPGPSGSEEDEWNFSIGLAYYPMRNARSNTVAGQCWMPQMPVANNGYFLVDTNRH